LEIRCPATGRKSLGRIGKPNAAQTLAVYFSELFTDVKVLLSCGPMPCTVATIASAMPLAIRQYSMAVAPDSSDQNFANKFRTLPSSNRHEFFDAVTTASLAAIGSHKVDRYDQ
jgi:hypothetical protein